MSANRLLFSGKIVKNASWLIGGNIFQKLLAFIVGIWMARYLGPSNYGLINYAAAYTTFFFSFSTLGINSIIVKELIDEPEKDGLTLGTALLLQCLASIFSIFTIFIIIWFIDFGEKQTITVVMLCSLGLFFQTFDTVRYWFQAKLESKYAVIATMIAYAVVTIYKIILLLLGKSVEWFAVATSIDYLIVAVILLYAYKQKGGLKFGVSITKAKKLLNSSKHFILAGLMVSIYGATDRLMLKQMLDESAVGFYGTAVSICNVWVFILAAIIDSFNPVILEEYNNNRLNFEKKNRQLYAIVFYCAVIVGIFMTVFAEIGIKLLYGEAYLPAVTQLKIITWYVAFSYLGVARNTWIVCKNSQKNLIYIYIGAAATNVALNFVLIPRFGANGAAVASLITQFSTIFIFPIMIKELRPNIKLMIDAIRLKNIR